MVTTARVKRAQIIVDDGPNEPKEGEEGIGDGGSKGGDEVDAAREVGAMK